MAIEEISKGRNIYKSQFSMGQLDFERYDKIFRAADEYGVSIRCNVWIALKPFYAALSQFYSQIKSIWIDTKNIEELENLIIKDFKTMELQERNHVNYTSTAERLRDNLIKWSERIYEIKQWVGLGIEVKKELSQKKKWEQAGKLS